MVALGARTVRGRTLFAKNSDRPAGECQPLVVAEAAEHAPGARLRCQYIEIEQARRTHGFVGAGPYWLWGLEHGVNDCGVAIGNHTIFTKEAIGNEGLQGMDVVRLGLERAATATGAVGVLVELIERYGQGGSGYVDTVWPYHNSFLVADRGEAWLVEASGRHWVAKQARGGLSASNHTTIGEDWDRIGAETDAFARAQGWWSGSGRFDFARAYRDSETVPPVVSSGRYATTCRALDAASPALDLASTMRVMRDHYDGGDVYVPGRTPDDERYFSVCEHADPVGQTTASMVVELPDTAGAPTVVWVAFTNPCVSPYLPLVVGAPVPAAMTAGGAEADAESAWWRFKRLLGWVEEDFATRGPEVRRHWAALERSFVAEVNEAEANEAEAKGADTAALDAVVRSAWERVSASELLDGRCGSDAG